MVVGRFIRTMGALLACAGVSMLLAQTAYAADDALIASAPPAEAESASVAFNAENFQAIAQLPSSDEQFASYVEQEFAKVGPSTIGPLSVQKVTRGSLLTDQEAIVYDVLIDRIHQIAAGRESSGIVTVPAIDFSVQQTYTAAELGLDTVCDSQNPDRVSQQAKSAVIGRLNLVMPRILNAVLSDCPYELYWFDKTIGIVFDPPELTVTADDSGGTVRFADSAAATFSMYVSADYSPLHESGQCIADTAKTSAASQAAQTAYAIVQEHEDEADYEKLYSYLCAVSKLTDYNGDADPSSASTPVYGDPWQVIYVFDGNPATKVVCEGYSKAFQYLCDLSMFSDSSIACNSVTGDMLGGKGAGAHMWNIVAIGAKNYLVDVTNNDNHPDEGSTDSSAASHDELFLAGAHAVERNGRTGYRIDWLDAKNGSKHWIEYYYDQETHAFFSSAELSLSATSYAQDLGGEGGDPSDPQQTDEELAASVTALINAIGEASYDERSAQAIKEARAAYDALNDAQKALVKNVFVLINAETNYALLKLEADEAAQKEAAEREEAQKAEAARIEADKKAIAAVTSAIAKLPSATEATDADAPAARAARHAYDRLTAAQKKQVPTADLKRLSKIETAARTTITIKAAKVTKAAIAKACKKAGKKLSAIKKVVLSTKVKRVGKAVFSQLKKAKTLVVKTKKLKKSTVEGCLSKSKMTSISVRVGGAKANKSYAAKYKRLFTKKIVGKKPRVSY